MFRRLADLGRRVTIRIQNDAELGQTTAEYALVILGSAAVATLLLTWVTMLLERL
jgi:Protein of unknown function (DUF4244)